MPTGMPRSSEAFLTARKSWLCSAEVPCDRFSRATVMPDEISSDIISYDFVAGPRVQTILVLGR